MNILSFSKWIDEKSCDGISSVTFKRDGDKEFKMFFAGNLDLYFSISNFENNPSFIIGKENYAVYNIFDRLYNDIISGVLINCDDFDRNSVIFETDYFRDFEMRTSEMRECTLKFLKDTKLVNDDKIEWHSDDFDYDIAPYFEISKFFNSYKISFIIPSLTRKLSDEELFYLPKRDDDFISVRIRNSGSRYGMFNIPFMRAYTSLLELDNELNQIHFVEYLILEQVKKGESLEKILFKR